MSVVEPKFLGKAVMLGPASDTVKHTGRHPRAAPGLTDQLTRRAKLATIFILSG